MFLQTLFTSRFKVKSDQGFTLIELLVVIVIIGILATLAGPTWLQFVRARRMNAVNDAIFQAIEQAKNRAQQEKLSYSVGFRTINGIPQVAVYPAELNAPANGSTFDATEQQAMDAAWAANALDSGVGLRPNDVAIATNLVGENDIATNPAGGYEFDPGVRVATIPETVNLNQPPTYRMTFDVTGTIANSPESANQAESGAVFVAGMIENRNQVNQIQPGTKIMTRDVRCVWSSTLLGGLEVGRNRTSCIKFLKGDTP
jgi:prepilin-type N-terminal cleavage/methylation domain-containing protein